MLYSLRRLTFGAGLAGFCLLASLPSTATAQASYQFQSLTASLGGVTLPVAPIDVNERGQVLGRVAQGTGTGYVIWQSGAAQPLTLPGSFIPTAFNDSGVFLGGSTSGWAVWRSGGVFALGVPQGHGADVWHIANDGTISGVLYRLGSGPRGPIPSELVGAISWQAADPSSYLTSPLRELLIPCRADYGTVQRLPGLKVAEGIGQSVDTCPSIDYASTNASRYDGRTVVDLNTLTSSGGQHLGFTWAISERGWIVGETEFGNGIGYLLRPTVEPTALPTSKLRVTAAATSFGGLPGVMMVLVNGVVRGSWAIEGSNYLPYEVQLPRLAGGEKIELTFINDALDTATGADRNLFISSLEVDGKPIDLGNVSYLPTGSTAQAFRRVMPWNGSLTLTAPAPVAGGDTLVVRARSSLALGIGAQMAVRVNDQLVNTVDVSSTLMKDYSVPLGLAVGPGARIDITFTNDFWDAATGSDRNLFVERLTVAGRTLLPTDADVVYDIGVGTAAFDGLSTRAGQSVMPWSGSLRFKLN